MSLSDLHNAFEISDESTRTALLGFHARLLATPLRRTPPTSLRRAVRCGEGDDNDDEEIRAAIAAVRDEAAAATLVMTLQLVATRAKQKNATTTVVKSNAVVVGLAIPAESAAVRQLLFVIQGVDTDAIRFDASTRQFLVAVDGLTSGAHALATRVCELGRAFRRVDAFVTRGGSGSGSGHGAVLQALLSGVREQLAAYRRDVSALEAQWRRGALSLRALAAWAAHVGGGERLLWLAAVCAAAKEARGGGGALLRVVAAHAAHGSDEVRALGEALVAQMSDPVRAMTLAWVLRGTVPAAADGDEFFVAEQGAAWADRFVLRDERLPPAALLARDDAHLALVLGKSVHFLAGACGDDDVLGVVAAAAAACGGELRATIRGAAATVNRRLLDAVFERHRLFAHVAAVRDFLTLAQGEFAAALLAALRDELALPAASLARHRLIEALDGAVRACGGAHGERLDIRLELEHGGGGGGGGAVGWDVLVLDYRVEAPLDAVLSPLCMRVYRRAFRWLLRVRRVGAALRDCWARQAALRRGDATLHALQLLRANMARFVDCLLQHFYVEALDDAWRRVWLAGARRAADLDGVIGAHERYLEALLTGLLLAPAAAAARRALEQLLRVCLGFAAFHERVVAEARRGIAPAALDAARLAGLGRQFARLLAELLALLEADDRTAPLAAQLDFSEFYRRQQQDQLLEKILGDGK